MSKKTKEKEVADSLMAMPGTSASRAIQKPLVFVSHDSRDADLAEAFSNLLTDASGGTLRSFRSSDKRGTAGIEFGQEWYQAIMEKLSTATDVVALLTPRSLNRPWILYETGVAKGKLDTVVFGVAVGVPLEKVSTGPFAQFQNCAEDEDSLTKLVLQLIKRNPDAEPREEAVRLQVQAFTSKLGALLKEKPVASSPRMDEVAVAKLFEEVKVMFQELPSRLEDRISFSSGERRRRTISLPPPVLFDTALRLDEETQGLDGLLMIASLLRDDFPWLYEQALELYRTAKVADRETIQNGIRVFVHACNWTLRGPLGHELSSESRELRQIMREVPEFLDHYFHRYFDRRYSEPKRRRITGQK